jgi:hypothetical protein
MCVLSTSGSSDAYLKLRKTILGHGVYFSILSYLDEEVTSFSVHCCSRSVNVCRCGKEIQKVIKNIERLCF